MVCNILSSKFTQQSICSCFSPSKYIMIEVVGRTIKLGCEYVVFWRLLHGLGKLCLEVMKFMQMY